MNEEKLSEEYLNSMHLIVDPWRFTGDFDDETTLPAYMLSCLKDDGSIDEDRLKKLYESDDETPEATWSKLDEIMAGDDRRNAKFLCGLFEDDVRSGSEMTAALHRAAFSLDCFERGMNASDLKETEEIMMDEEEWAEIPGTSGRDPIEFLIDAVRTGNRDFFTKLSVRTSKSYFLQNNTDYGLKAESDDRDKVPVYEENNPISRELIRKALKEKVISVERDSEEAQAIIGICRLGIDPRLEDSAGIEEMLEAMRVRPLNNPDNSGTVYADRTWLYCRRWIDSKLRPERVSLKPFGWKMTDDSCSQYCRCLGSHEFELIECERISEDHDLFVINNQLVDINDYDDDELEKEISFFYPSLEAVRKEYGINSAEIIAECIFENTSPYDSEEMGPMTETQAKEYILSYILKNKS